MAANIQAEYEGLISDLKNRAFQPIYLLHGEESYFIDLVANYMASEVLTEEEKAFNLSVLYGRDLNAAALMETVKRYPMNADYQVVVVKEAQQMRDLDATLPYFLQPQPSTLLVICYKHKSLDKRTKFAKEALKNATVLHSVKLYENQVPAFIQAQLKASGRGITPQAAELLTDYLGNDLSRIAGELEKLQLNMGVDQPIDSPDIETHIGISKDYNVFELQNAIGSKDVVKANRIVNYVAANPKSNPMVLVVGALYRFFSSLYVLSHHSHAADRDIASLLKINPFFVKDYKLASSNFSLSDTESAIAILHEYDLRSKGVDNPATSEGELLKEMVYKLLHL